jgi:hypothetical protein
LNRSQSFRARAKTQINGLRHSPSPFVFVAVTRLNILRLLFIPLIAEQK